MPPRREEAENDEAAAQDFKRPRESVQRQEVVINLPSSKAPEFLSPVLDEKQPDCDSNDTECCGIHVAYIITNSSPQPWSGIPPRPS